MNFLEKAPPVGMLRLASSSHFFVPLFHDFIVGRVKVIHDLINGIFLFEVNLIQVGPDDERMQLRGRVPRRARAAVLGRRVPSAARTAAPSASRWRSSRTTVPASGRASSTGSYPCSPTASRRGCFHGRRARRRLPTATAAASMTRSRRRARPRRRRASAKVTATAAVYPKRPQILVSARGCIVLKLHYISELERSVASLQVQKLCRVSSLNARTSSCEVNLTMMNRSQTEVSALSPRVAFLDPTTSARCRRWARSASIFIDGD
jgi:hypothetical protein